MSGASNFEEAIDQLRMAGLRVSNPVIGKLTRCLVDGEKGPERSGSGWYSINELLSTAGDLLLVGAFGNWREVGADGRPLVHRIELKKREVTAEERAAIRARIAESRRIAEARRKRNAERAARHAEHAWGKCAPTGESPYLKTKGVEPHGVRFSPGGNLVIPITDTLSKIHGLQIIYDDPGLRDRKGRAKDYWPAGLNKRGHFHLIGMPTWIVLVDEGYATGASLHEATGLPVAIAFDAGNLRPVAEALHRRYPVAKILICGDDDFLSRCPNCGKQTPSADPTCEHCGEEHRKTNTGKIAASAAALAVGGADLLPVFAERGRKKLTDFNDLHQAEGLHVVREQVAAKLAALHWDQPGKRPASRDAGGDGGPAGWSIDGLLKRYALIYSTETVFDSRERMVLTLGALRAAAGKGTVRMWLEHPDRRTVMPADVVFDPAGAAWPELCNLWGGWPTTPAAGNCERLLELLEYLCSREDRPHEVYTWLLKWLAYPIQHPGVKMQTAVLMHGPEGTGKNIIFGVIRKIYAEYGGIFDQTQLESQFNGWASGKLFMIGNEVVSRAELYHQQGRLKNMITESEWQVNEKNLPVRLEANHCNFVFFSNRLDIAKLDPEDRRYCVIWTPPPVGPEFYAEVVEERDRGGVEALHQYLLDLDLGDFAPHSKPPHTRARRELVEMSMDSTERFWRSWTDGELPVPCIPCRSQDLYSAYRLWGTREGVIRLAPAAVLIAMIKKKPLVRVSRERILLSTSMSPAQCTIVWPPADLSDQPTAENQRSWLGKRVEAFEIALKDWKEGLS